MSSENKTRAVARVQVLVDISLDAEWGDDCKVDQIYKQAAEEALGVLRNAKRGVTNLPLPLTIVGEPKVIMVLAERKS